MPTRSVVCGVSELQGCSTVVATGSPGDDQQHTRRTSPPDDTLDDTDAWQVLPGLTHTLPTETNKTSGPGSLTGGSLLAAPRLSHLTAGAGAVLFRFWCQLDEDQDGQLTKEEFGSISYQLGVRWDVDEVWAAIVRESDAAEVEYVRNQRKALGQQITFQGFVYVYNNRMGQVRRSSRLDVKTTFEKLQEVPEGLHKAGIAKLYRGCKHLLFLLPPMFDLDKDWALMQELSDDDDEQKTVVFLVFERWWKLRMGLMEADTPVIPEYFQYKLEELHKADELEIVKENAAKSNAVSNLRANTSLKASLRKYQEYDPDIEEPPSKPPPRTGEQLWKTLRTRLDMLVTMRRDWGNVHDFYGSSDSQYGETALNWNVRDPESSFSSNWDMMQVIFLCFVTYTVPYRAGFGVEIELLSMWWYLDTIIDLYFVIDLVLNFFTAFYDTNGVREGRLPVIAKSYLRGWFAIDFVSCLPVQYIMLLVDSGNQDDSGGNLRVIKTLRLMRLSKMLRLARIKRILAKYENLEFVQQYSGMLALVFIIAFAGHLLACFWYMIGVTPGDDRQGNQIPGWVLLEYCPKCADPTDGGYAPCSSLPFQGSEEDCPSRCDWIPAASAAHGTTDAACIQSDGCVVGCELDPSVAMSTRYITSMYYVFNGLDGNGRTDVERAFAVFAYIVTVIIDGAVAGVLSAVMIQMGGTERQVNEKLAAAKTWMREHRISKQEQVKALSYFRHVYRSHVMYQEADILNTVSTRTRARTVLITTAPL